MRLASGCGVKIVPVYNKPFLYRYKPHKKQKFFRYFAASECYGPAEYVGRSKTIGKIHFQVLACEAYCRYPTYRGMEDPTGSTESKLMAVLAAERHQSASRQRFSRHAVTSIPTRRYKPFYYSCDRIGVFVSSVQVSLQLCMVSAPDPLDRQQHAS
jgi:hypothetical protein